MRYFLMIFFTLLAFTSHASQVVKLGEVKFCYVNSYKDLKCGEIPKRYEFLKQDILKIIETSPKLVKQVFFSFKKLKIIKTFKHDWVIAGYNKYKHELTISAKFLDETYLKTPKFRSNGRHKHLKNWSKISKAPINYDAKTNKINFFLAQMLLHEIGHAVDYLYFKSNPFACANEKQITNGLMIDSIIKLTSPIEKDYCNKIYDTDNVGKIYDQLMQSQFVSLYATCKDSEDFAETFSAYILKQYFNFNLKIKDADKEVYDSNQRLAHKHMQYKLQMVKAILGFAKLDNLKLKKAINEHRYCTGAFQFK